MDDLVRQTNALDEANRAKTRFLAAASHDLRQPMQAVVLLVESLQERIREPEHQRIVESIRTSVVSMSALLNAILDVSKFDAGTVKVERSHFPVSQVLERLSSEFSLQARQKGLALRVRPSNAVVETDPILLYRILANFCNNALRYTPHGGILVAARRRGRDVTIEVWDTGIGIPHDQHRDIFREFHQLANPQRDRTQGLGLGLAIVERTANLLGHAIGCARARTGDRSFPSPSRGAIPPGCAYWKLPARGARRLHRAGDRGRGRDPGGDVDPARGLGSAAARGPRRRRGRCVAGGGPGRARCRDRGLPPSRRGNRHRAAAALPAGAPRRGGILVTGDIGADVLREAQAAGLEVLHKPVRPARLRSLLGVMRRRKSAALAAASTQAP
jgi:two-component sensor histidine kinase